MGTSSFSNLYFEFIQLAFDLEYTSKMLIRKFKYKLTLNSEVKFPILISALFKWCLSIYKQIQATDKIQDKTKPLRLSSTLASIYSIVKIY